MIQPFFSHIEYESAKRQHKTMITNENKTDNDIVEYRKLKERIDLHDLLASRGQLNKYIAQLSNPIYKTEKEAV